MTHIDYIQRHFLDFLEKVDKVRYLSYTQALENPKKLSKAEESACVIELAPFVEEFIGQHFSIEKELKALQEAHSKQAIIYRIKREFVQRVALKSYDVADLDSYQPHLDFPKESFDLDCAHFIEGLLKTHNEEALKRAALYCVWAVHTREGKEKHKKSVLFQTPVKIDFDHLLRKPENPCMNRDGFSLTDKGFSLPESLAEAHYCIHCHKQDKDTCSKGFKDKVSENFTKNPLGIPLQGCPLDQKISEMNTLKMQGSSLGALAVAMIDNPLLAATGHRICNDCMKACIFQKQTPVNIPGCETEILESILNLPHGVEIYKLLTRWNPLNFNRPISRPLTGHKILVVGAGPAGFSLSYQLLQEGHTVVLIDGSKIEHHSTHKPIASWKDFCSDLDTRVIDGFGGVMEYGITVRWNKNYLKLIRCVLEEYPQFKLMGGVRFGGTLTSSQAFDELGFDHIALCMGAGKPHLLTLNDCYQKTLARGVRYASDFLMALQLGGAYQKKTQTDLPIELPVIVIGGGLTSIDTATEALAYYPRYVQKNPQHPHYTLFEEERQCAVREKRDVNFLPLLENLGGCTLLYRRSLTESPAYKLNHEEVQHALQQGVKIIDEAELLDMCTDEKNTVTGVLIKNNRGEKKFIPAKTVLIATGTEPNTNILDDEPSIAEKEGNGLKEISPFVIHKRNNHKAMTMFGDMHPRFAGNVVKAMASAKRGYLAINQLLQQKTHLHTLSQHEIEERNHKFLESIEKQLSAEIIEMNSLTENALELVIKAPMAVKNFKPGQFFRFQNFASKSDAPLLKAMPLSGIDVDPVAGTISLIVLQTGASSKACQHLKVGESVSLMGPTGAPTFIPEGKKVLLIGGGLGNAILLPIARAMHEKKCTVTFIAGYQKGTDIFKKEAIEEASDHIIWCLNQSDAITLHHTLHRPIHTRHQCHILF